MKFKLLLACLLLTTPLRPLSFDNLSNTAGYTAGLLKDFYPAADILAKVQNLASGQDSKPASKKLKRLSYKLAKNIETLSVLSRRMSTCRNKRTMLRVSMAITNTLTSIATLSSQLYKNT